MRVSLSAFPPANKIPIHIPPNINPQTADTRILRHPRKNPDTAISLISPPPNAPGAIRQIKKNGRPPQSIPRSLPAISLLHSSVPGLPRLTSMSISNTARTKMDVWHLSCILRPVISCQKTTSRIQKNILSVNLKLTV